MAELDRRGAGCGSEAALAEALTRPEVAAFLAGVMDCAPFLRGLILDDPARLAKLLATDPAAAHAQPAPRPFAARGRRARAELKATLRRGRQEAALLTALADLGGVWDVVQVTAALTAFADAAVGAAVRFSCARPPRPAASRLPIRRRRRRAAAGSCSAWASTAPAS